MEENYLDFAKVPQIETNTYSSTWLVLSSSAKQERFWSTLFGEEYISIYHLFVKPPFFLGRKKNLYLHLTLQRWHGEEISNLLLDQFYWCMSGKHEVYLENWRGLGRDSFTMPPLGCIFLGKKVRESLHFLNVSLVILKWHN